MSWLGPWFGVAPTVAPPALPNITNATTEDAVRDRAIEVIRTLVPSYVPAVRFVPHRNEHDGEFPDWCEQNPQSALRRYQVRFDGVIETPAVSNNDHEERVVLLTTMVAYPHNAKTGAKQALDRDTAISRDRDQLDRAIGVYSRPNFIAPNPDASWTSGDTQRVRVGAVDLLIITGLFRFRRAL